MIYNHDYQYIMNTIFIAILFALIVYFYMELFNARARRRRIKEVTRVQKERVIEEKKKEEIKSITAAIQDVEKQLQIQEELTRLTGQQNIANLDDSTLINQALIKQRRGRPEMLAHIDQTLRQSSDVVSGIQTNLVDFDTNPEKRLTANQAASTRINPEVQRYYTRYQSQDPVRNLNLAN